MCVSPILLILQWCLLGCLWLQHLLYQVFCPVVLMAKEKAPVVSFKGEKKKGKENKILIYMFSHLIIYFMFVVSLGQIFHLHSFKNHFWDFTHAVINNAFLVLMSNGWVWENLVKVQAGFTSFLNPFRTFLNIFFFHPFLRILEHITKVDQKKKKVTVVTNYCHIPVTITGWFWEPHKTTYCAATNKMRHLFCIVHLATCPHSLA